MSELPIKRSETIGALVGALAAAQGVFGSLVKTHVNTYTGKKYADLADVIAATQSGMSKNGLSLIQVPIRKDDAQEAGVFSILAHSSGEWISVELILPATMKAKDGAIKFDQQSIGSAITYARRYTWQALVGVAAEEDDDGNAATDQSDPRQDAPKPKQVRAPEVNKAAAKSDQSSRPNTPTAQKPASQANDPAPAVDSGVPKAIIPPEAPVAHIPVSEVKNPSQPETPVSSPSEQLPGTSPNKTQFDGYTARAMALKQPLEKAGLKPSKNLTTGAKLKAFLLSTTGVKELTELTNESWEKFLTETEEAVKVDPSAVVARIEGGA
jgi:ERF superfamily